MGKTQKTLVQAFFGHSKKTQGEKTQNSRKKLKLKLKTQIFGIFGKKNCTFSENMFLTFLNIRYVVAWYQYP